MSRIKNKPWAEHAAIHGNPEGSNHGDPESSIMHWHADGISGNTYHPNIINKKRERWESKNTLQARMAVEAASPSYSAEGISPAKPFMRILQSTANMEDH